MMGHSVWDISSFQVLYPTDSYGRVCGNGDLKNKSHLLFFDLTRCLNPAVLTLGCPTPQVINTDLNSIKVGSVTHATSVGTPKMLQLPLVCHPAMVYGYTSPVTRWTLFPHSRWNSSTRYLLLLSGWVVERTVVLTHENYLGKNFQFKIRISKIIF
jgi:hypothetical protein